MPMVRVSNGGTDILEYGYYEDVASVFTCFYSDLDNSNYIYRNSSSYPYNTNCLTITADGGIITITVNTDGNLKLDGLKSSDTSSEIHNGYVANGAQFELNFTTTYMGFSWCLSK